MQDNCEVKLPDVQKDERIHKVNKSYGWKLLESSAKPLTDDDSAKTEHFTTEKIENQQG